MQSAEPQILQAMDRLTQTYREMCQEAGVEVTEEELREPAEKLSRMWKSKQAALIRSSSIHQKSAVVL
jgi:hypothetical protein